MSGNSFGKIFKITTCGESHGGAIAVIIDGCPPRLVISVEEIQAQLNRRRPGQSKITSPRQEPDKIQILSGIFNGETTGTPILLLVYNQDMKPEDYTSLINVYRPGHADFTYNKKYRIRDHRGSGRASARETIARVASGAIARKFLQQQLNIEIIAYVDQIGNLKTDIDHSLVTYEDVENNIVRCPDLTIVPQMIDLIEKIKKDQDSIGGSIKCVIRNMIPGLGEPVFDKLPADLAKAMLSINAVKAFEIGSGFAAASMLGSENNDQMTIKNNAPAFLTNNSGGTLGGISTGEDIYFRVGFKPVSTINKTQQTVNDFNEIEQLVVKGRHDPCVLPRAVPIVEAMAALVIMDHYLRFSCYEKFNV